MIKYDKSNLSRHKQIVIDFFGLALEERVPCELCVILHKQNRNHVIAQAVDVHHAYARGMGGDPTGSKDTIENLGMVCRSCHDKLEANPELNEAFKEWLAVPDTRKKIVHSMMYGN